MPPVQGEKRFPYISAGWIDLEDEVLRRAHQKHGSEDRKWVKVSGYFEEKEPQQCRNRWRRALNPAIKRAKRGGSGQSSSEKDIDLNYKELVFESSLVTEVGSFCLHTLLLNSLLLTFHRHLQFCFVFPGC